MQCRRKDSNLHEHRWLTRPSTQRVTPPVCVLGAVPCKVKTLECTRCNMPKSHKKVRGVIQGVTGPGRTKCRLWVGQLLRREERDQSR